MTLDAWLLFCATDTILCFTPGPAVLLVVSLALSRGAGAGLGGSLGILAANSLYFCLSATGIGAVLLASWNLFFLIKWLGAAYLVWMGVRMLLARTNAYEPEELSEPGSKSRRGRSPFTLGVVTQGANPKALVFFSALVPQFIDPRAAVLPQIAILGVSSILIELVALSVYVAVCHRLRRTVWRSGLALSLDRAGGALLIGAGAGLATLRRV